MNQTENHDLRNDSAKNTAFYASQGNADSDEISLIDLILILWKGNYIIVACTILATVAGVIYALRAPEVFSSTSHFITKTGRSWGGGWKRRSACSSGRGFNGQGRQCRSLRVS